MDRSKPTRVSIAAQTADLKKAAYADLSKAVYCSGGYKLLRPSFEALRDHRDGIDLGRVVDLFSLSIFGPLR